MQPYEIQEHRYGNLVWVAIRARGAEWSWLQPHEAADLGKQLVAAFANEETERAE